MNEFELRLYASRFGLEELKGFDHDMTQLDTKNMVDKKQFFTDLLENNFFEIDHDNGKYTYTAYGQRIINIMNHPKVWLSIENKKKQMKRNIYVEGIDYLCADMLEDEIKINLLPVLPFAIGAYAEMLENLEKTDRLNTLDNMVDLDDESDIIIQGFANINMQMNIITDATGNTIVIQKGDEIEIVSFSEEECVNYITDWLLNNLQEMDGE